MEDNKDLLDLCRLNLLEEHVEEAVAPEREITLKVIEWQKRRVVQKIKNRIASEVNTKIESGHTTKP